MAHRAAIAARLVLTFHRDRDAPESFDASHGSSLQLRGAADARPTQSRYTSESSDASRISDETDVPVMRRFAEEHGHDRPDVLPVRRHGEGGLGDASYNVCPRRPTLPTGSPVVPVRR
jgi:hypothetical protein